MNTTGLAANRAVYGYPQSERWQGRTATRKSRRAYDAARAAAADGAAALHLAESLEALASYTRTQRERVTR